MKFTGLDGKIYAVVLKSNISENPSKLHLRARLLLTNIYPHDIILEEVELPGGNKMRADFYLPLRKLMVECQGEQHSKRVSYFQKNILDFGRQLRRDNAKAFWCELNSVTLVCLNYDESDEIWKRKIIG